MLDALRRGPVTAQRHVTLISEKFLSSVRRKSKIIFYGLVVFGFGLIGFRLYLPTWVKNYSNRVLDKIPGYHGHIDDVRIHLWRSAYSIIGLNLLKTGGSAPVPFFSAPKIDFSLHWGALFHGQLVGKLEIDRPQLNFVTGKSPQQQQTSIDKSWQQQVKSLFPLRISRLGIKDGEIHFRNYEARPPVDVYIHHLSAVATNLTNSRKVSRTLKATLDARGTAMSNGALQTHLEMDPLGAKPTFDLTVQLKGLDLRELNNFFAYYLAVEMKQGTFSFYMEGSAREGAFKGYAKPILDRPDLVKIKENPSVGEMAKALVVKFVSYVMKNHPKDRLATRFDVSGTVNNPDADVWSAIMNFLKNWLIKAIPHGLEGKK